MWDKYAFCGGNEKQAVCALVNRDWAGRRDTVLRVQLHCSTSYFNTCREFASRRIPAARAGVAAVKRRVPREVNLLIET